jgi:hypothetical protein
MPNLLHKYFLDHPSQVDETYVEHMGHSSAYGWRLLKAALCAFCHALVPELHKTTASDTVKAMAKELGGRAIVAREERMRRAGAYDPVI